MEHAVENSKHAVHRGSVPTHIPQALDSRSSQHPMLVLQQQAGNQAVQALLRSHVIQAKLAVSQPDDPDEHEADQVADQIMRSRGGAPISTSCSCAEGEEMCEECQQKRTTVQRRADTSQEPISVPDGQQYLRSRALTPPIRLALSTLSLPELSRQSAGADSANAAPFAGHVAESPYWHGAPDRERKTCIDAYGCAWCNESRGIMQVAVDHEHCAGDCVKQHEQRHVQDDTLCCERYGRCMANAAVGQNPCRDAWDSYQRMTSDWTECNAYYVERNCLLDIVNNRCRCGVGGLDETCCAELQQQLTFVDQKSNQHCPKALQMPCPFAEDGSIMKLSTTTGTPASPSPTPTTASPGSSTPGSLTPGISTPESAPPDTTPPPAARLSRKCACRGEAEDEPEQNPVAARKSADSSSWATSYRGLEHVLRSPGQPLDLATRAFFEARFGRDFSAVRVHTDAAAADSARSIKARAYTAGSDVVFAPGKLNP